VLSPRIPWRFLLLLVLSGELDHAKWTHPEIWIDKRRRVCALGSMAGPSPGHKPSAFACKPPHDVYPFCNVSLPVVERVNDLVRRINDTDKPNLLTARGKGGSGSEMQALCVVIAPTVVKPIFVMPV
jgi:hypothetical protein